MHTSTLAFLAAATPATPPADEESVGALLTRAQELASQWGPSVIAALVILVVGWIGARLVTGGIRRVMRRAHVEETLVKFLTNLAYMAIMTLVIIAALGKLGVPTTSFTAIVAAAGLAIGFALKDSLSNFASGVMLIVFRPFKVGDFIEAAGQSGVVEEILVFQTVLRTGDNKKVIVGNASITGGSIINYSAKDTRRVDMVFGISYDDDIRQAKQILERILGEDERILKDPAPVVAVSELADSSVNFVARPWVATADYWAVKFDVTEKVKLTFDAENITIPYPQSDVHMHQVAAG